mgnify:CR=1 FL=1
MLKTRMAPMNQQTKAVIDYVQAFLDQAADADADQDWINEQWQSETNIASLTELLKKTTPKNQAAKRTSTDKKLKDPNKPKKGKSAYILFCADERPAAKAALGGDAKPTEVTAEIGRRWNALKDSDSAADKRRYKKYTDASVADKRRYEEEMLAYVPPSDEDLELLAAAKPKRGRKSTKKSTADDGKPKKSKSAYILYCQEQRPIIKAEMPDAKATEVTAELGSRWNALKKGAEESDALKVEYDKYLKLANDDKERYESEMEAWGGAAQKTVPKAKPSKPVRKKDTPEDPEATQPMDDDVDTDVEDIVEEPKKSTRKLPGFVNKKPTVKDPGFDTFAAEEEVIEVATKALGPKATKAAIKKHILGQWTELSSEDRAWYAENQ